MTNYLVAMIMLAAESNNLTAVNKDFCRLGCMELFR